MITVEQIAQIRHAYYNEGRSVRWIAREYHHSREKVRQALDNPEPQRYTRTKPKPAPVMDAWKPRIDALLVDSEGLPRKHRYTAQRIYDLLYAEGYRGCVGGVRNYVAKRRGKPTRMEVYVPLEFESGQDAQADWGEALVELHGVQRTVQVFTMRLCYSRMTFACAYPTERQECLFDGHVRAFAFFGGLPHRISYDNLSTAVQTILAGKGRREQQAFTQLRSHYLFESRFCTPGEGHEKGQIEHAVGYVRRNFLTPLLKADSFEALNVQLLQACRDDLRRTVDGQPDSIYAQWQLERPQLRPLPEHPFACCITTQAALTPYSQVVFETNRYSVPADQAQRVVERQHGQLRALAKRSTAKAMDAALAARALAVAPKWYKAETTRERWHHLRVQQYRDRYEQAHTLRRQGLSISAVARQMGLNRRTVQTLLAAETYPGIPTRGRTTRAVVAFEGYLRQRWGEGVRNIARLLPEIRAQGYQGTYAALWSFVRSWAAGEVKGDAAPTLAPASAPSPRAATWWLLGKTERLSVEQLQGLRQWLVDCPQVERVRRLALQFVAVLHGRDTVALRQWLADAEESGVVELRRFAAGLRGDYAAVEGAVAEAWSNGMVEGHVNRLKVLKRQMYGRAKFDLLRIRVLNQG